MSYPGTGELGLAAHNIEELLDADASAGAATGRTVLSARGLASVADGHLPAAEADSTPGAVAFRTVLRRSARTLAPILVADLVALLCAGLLTEAILAIVYPPAALAMGWGIASVALLPLVLAYAIGGLYSEVWVHVVIELRQLTLTTTTCVLAAALGAAHAWPLPVWCLVAWPVAVAAVPLMRTVAHGVCQKRRWWGYPVVVIGTGEGADTVVRALLAAPRSGLRPVLVSDPLGACRTSILPVVNDTLTLESLVRAQVIRHAVVSLPDLSHRRLGEALDRYGRFLPHLLVLSEASTLPTLWSAARNGGRLSGIQVRNGVLLATLQSVKRAVDTLIAVVVLLAGAPVLLAVAAVVRLTSDGPVLFGHMRIGRHGRPFRAWKFRTMRADSDAVLKAHLEADPAARAEWARDHKLTNDPRVTRVGGFLRKSSLDELPQLWNVLRGEMSLVGPRPSVDGEVWRYGQAFRPYTTVKPGITGLWQVSGRNDIGYDERVQLDEFYIRHWSLWLDAYVVAKTAVALLSRRGAR